MRQTAYWKCLVLFLDYLGRNSWKVLGLFYSSRYTDTYFFQVSFTLCDYCQISDLVGLKCWASVISTKILVLRPADGRLLLLQPILHTFSLCQNPGCAEDIQLAKVGFFCLLVFYLNLEQNIVNRSLKQDILSSPWNFHVILKCRYRRDWLPNFRSITS